MGGDPPPADPAQMTEQHFPAILNALRDQRDDALESLASSHSFGFHLLRPGGYLLGSVDPSLGLSAYALPVIPLFLKGE